MIFASTLDSSRTAVTPRVVAVVVSYQPTTALINEVRALRPQVSKIVIVDNGSAAPTRALVDGLCGEGVEAVFLSKNLGLGAAHNMGIQRAREYGATHVLLMDQDSLPHADMVQKLLEAENTLLARGENVGALGPAYRDPRIGKLWPFYRMGRFGVSGLPCASSGILACDFLITSGTLVRLSILDKIGRLNEAYFLEHVDTEWSLRARNRGYGLYGVCDAQMDHALGDDPPFRVPFSERLIQSYQPYRHYYLFRNAVLLSRERHATLAWKLNELDRLLRRLVFFSTFTPPRLKRLTMMLLGLWHGLLGRTGPLAS